MLENKLGISSSSELAREEERISKTRAVELFETDFLSSLSAGTFDALSKIHAFLFSDIYDFAGKVRTVNISKGNFRFAPLMYLGMALENIDKMPQSTFDEIVEKYVEMNVAHPFREGNGRCQRLFFRLFCNKIGYSMDFDKVDADELMIATIQASNGVLDFLKDIFRKCLRKEKIDN